MTTKLGYAGLMDDDYGLPQHEIWILAGGSHPIVLRPVEDKKAHYNAICEAYIHGGMDGEATRGQCPVLPPHWPNPEFKHIYLV